jgi:hypothetical protein
MNGLEDLTWFSIIEKMPKRADMSYSVDVLIMWEANEHRNVALGWYNYVQKVWYAYWENSTPEVKNVIAWVYAGNIHSITVAMVPVDGDE